MVCPGWLSCNGASSHLIVTGRKTPIFSASIIRMLGMIMSLRPSVDVVSHTGCNGLSVRLDLAESDTP